MRLPCDLELAMAGVTSVEVRCELTCQRHSGFSPLIVLLTAASNFA